MITKSQVIPMLLQASPGFQPAWQEHVTYWNGQESGCFNDAAEFARLLVVSFERGDTSEFPAVFATIERILNEGDSQARDVAAIGILEDLQTIGSNHSCGADVFVKWLGPTSRAAWAQIAKMWEGKNSLMDVLRSER
jgi:hypothetical protein